MTGFPSRGGREDHRRKSVPALVPTSETEGDGELRCFVSEILTAKKAGGHTKYFQNQIRKE